MQGLVEILKVKVYEINTLGIKSAHSEGADQTARMCVFVVLLIQRFIICIFDGGN